MRVTLLTFNVKLSLKDNFESSMGSRYACCTGAIFFPLISTRIKHCWSLLPSASGNFTFAGVVYVAKMSRSISSVYHWPGVCKQLLSTCQNWQLEKKKKRAFWLVSLCSSHGVPSLLYWASCVHKASREASLPMWDGLWFPQTQMNKLRSSKYSIFSCPW